MRALSGAGCLGLIAMGLSACTWVGTAAKEGPLSLTERRGLQSFTLVGELPAQFGLSITGWYSPVDDSGLNCEIANLYTNKPQARYLGKGFDIPISAEATSIKRTIPLTYHVGVCELRLNKIKMDIDGRFGEKTWQKTYANANFYIHARAVDGGTAFDTSETLRVDSECTWLFQQSKAKSRLGEISKLLTCKGAGANLQYDQLAGKTVTLAIRVNPEERPSMRNRWIKLDSGWKPCLGTEKSDRCQMPPLFKTFQMNGKTCSVYPGCTE